MFRYFFCFFALLFCLLSTACGGMFGSPYEEVVAEKFAGRHAPQKGSMHLPQFGSKLHWVQSGKPEAPLVFYLHGSWGSWDHAADIMVLFLAEPDPARQVFFLAIDRPGYGMSKDLPVMPDMKAQAALLAELITNIRPGEKAILVGHSYGGPLAARMAMDHPEITAGLVLVGASIMPEDDTRWYNHVADYPPISWLLPGPMQAANEEILGLSTELADMLPLWKDIRVPVVMVHGSEDDLVDPANVDFAKEQMKSTEVHSILLEGMGHFVPWERPDAVKQGIVWVLKKNAS
jgi:pimeloyl-ACP methyl ester carboxylesterase